MNIASNANSILTVCYQGGWYVSCLTLQGQGQVWTGPVAAGRPAGNDSIVLRSAAAAVTKAAG